MTGKYAIKILKKPNPPGKVWTEGHTWWQPERVIECKYCRCQIGSEAAKKLCPNSGNEPWSVA